MIERIKRWMCVWTHDEPMWPSHGQYRCRRCHTMHPVPWEQREPAAQAQEAHCEAAIA